MPSEFGSGERRPIRPPGPPPPEAEHLPCPRCDSTNTKFCYYNNYNFSQPRHFCKSCRRYWTKGGTLRDIPVGGGSRKNAKRCRTTSSGHDYRNNMVSSVGTPLFIPVSGENSHSVHFSGDVKPNIGMCGSFTSLLNNTQGPGLLSLSGFGLGVGRGLEEFGFGLGRGVWPFNGNVAQASLMGNTWQAENGEGGFVGGECFTLPDLAISTPGYSMK